MTDREYLEQLLRDDRERLREQLRADLAQRDQRWDAERLVDREYFEKLLREMWNDLSQLHRRSSADWAQSRDRQDEIDGRLHGLDARLDRIDRRVSEIESEFREATADLITLRRVATDNLLRMRRNVDTVRAEVHDPDRLARLTRIEARLVRLESHPSFLRDLPDPEP
jgi:hypothetical protein